MANPPFRRRETRAADFDRSRNHTSRGTTMAFEVINFAEKLGKFSERWSPRVVAEMNDYQFKLVKLQGDFVWHDHKTTDEAFLVIQGEMQVRFRDRDVTIRAGEMFVVPRGVGHLTRAERECHALVIEPRGVINTGEEGGMLAAPNDVWV
jgi:mannose-6-phosphate isomerase-like protein (cupin superfamily)